MNRLPHTDLRILMRLLILGSVAIVLASLPSLADQPAEALERESLKGVTGVEVLVDPLDVEIEELGLKTEALEKEIKQRLQKAGVHVLTERERLKIPSAGTLVIRVDALHDRIGRFFYSIDLFLTQRVRLESRTAPEISAATWMKLGAIGTVADDNVKHIQGQVLQKTDQFIKDYLAVNPGRKGREAYQQRPPNSKLVARPHELTGCAEEADKPFLLSQCNGIGPSPSSTDYTVMS